MNRVFFYRSFLVALFAFCAEFAFAQAYPGIVSVESVDDKYATFTTMGVALKKSDVELNAVQSLFNTLFYMGVDGVNNGQPLVTTDKPDYIKSFLNVKAMMYGGSRRALAEPVRNSQKMFEATYSVTVPIQNLMKELSLNGVSKAQTSSTQVVDLDDVSAVVMPTVIVVPYKKDGESYASILENDYDRRIAISKVQAGFEARNITTVDINAKVAAMKRRAEYESSTADSNDKQLLLSSGADVYVEVDLLKDIQSAGSRVSLIMKAYETSSGSVLASKDGFTRRFNTTALDLLCSYAVKENLEPFLNDITKNFNKQATGSKRVVLQISVDGNSMMTLNDQVGKNNYRLSDVIRQWVRSNSDQGKYHLQGIVPESMVFDYVMIPNKDSDGLMMDAAQFGFLLHSYLSESQGVSCSSKIDGNTIYITIE